MTTIHSFATSRKGNIVAFLSYTLGLILRRKRSQELFVCELFYRVMV